MRRNLNIHRLNLSDGDPKRTTSYFVEMPELTRLVADWRAYVAGGTPTGGVYVYYTDSTGADDRRLALKFDAETLLEVR